MEEININSDINLIGLTDTNNSSSEQPNSSEPLLSNSIDRELRNIDTDLSQLNFTNPIIVGRSANAAHNTEILESLEIERNFEFDTSNRANELNIQFGSDEFPRFNCACHKLNVAIR